MGSLARKGARRAILSLGHMAAAISGHFGARFAGIELVYEVETHPLGTGGAIRAALRRCTTDAALVVNGDTYLDLELPAVAAQWQARRRPILVGRHELDTGRYGRLEVDGDRLCGFAEKGAAGPGLINTGHYVLPKSVFDGATLTDPFSFEIDFLAPRIDQLGFEVFMTEGRFIDIGVPEDFRRAQHELAGLT